MKKLLLIAIIIQCSVTLTFSESGVNKRIIQLGIGVGLMNQDYAGFGLPVMVTPRVVIYNYNKDISISLNSPISFYGYYQKTVDDDNESTTYNYLGNIPLTLEFNFFRGANTYRLAERKAGIFAGTGINYTFMDKDIPWHKFNYYSPLYTIGCNLKIGKRTLTFRFTGVFYDKYKGFDTYLFGVQYQLFK